MRDSRYDILFEPLQIGPVTAPNRFYQVPHCTGMGRQRPRTLAAMRETKAEGGWGVVCTEYCSVHPTSDDTSFPFCTLWDNDDVRAHALMTNAVHKHGALAGVELWLGGSRVANHHSRQTSLGLTSRPSSGGVQPVQSRRLNRRDIVDIRRWQRDAARRAVEAEFDIVYVYATHGYLLSEFLDPSVNQRSDEYGGSLENRIRIVRELIEETRDAIAGKAAIAVRFSVDIASSETYDAFALLADLPDIWDLTVLDYSVEMAPSRFAPEGALSEHIVKARELTDRPIVAVGRYTSPDSMAAVLRSGQQDLIGAARPSIADPFLPSKIRDGRLEDIRECIGCNVCYAGDALGVPLRCTQNPTFGEEWRRGWHPDRVQVIDNGQPVQVQVKQSSSVLVVGSGPAGLEAARVLAEAGCEVMLAEARSELGGRVTIESRLPGLSEWARVRDWRQTQLQKKQNVGVYLASDMDAESVLDCETDFIVLATGARWAKSGIGRNRDTEIKGCQHEYVVSADDLLVQQTELRGHYVVYDDDHYYLSSVLALKLRSAGADVSIVCPEGRVCSWGAYTNEQHDNNMQLYRAGVRVYTNKVVESVDKNRVELRCIYTNTIDFLSADWFVPLASRVPNTSLSDSLEQLVGSRVPDDFMSRVYYTGDCESPGTIAAAVYAGYRTALSIVVPEIANKPALRDLPLVNTLL